MLIGKLNLQDMERRIWLFHRQTFSRKFKIQSSEEIQALQAVGKRGYGTKTIVALAHGHHKHK